MAQENPMDVGERLLKFSEDGGILNLLSRQVCRSHKYKCAADECDGCPGLAILAHLENQIGEAGVKYMTDLAKEWIENSIE